jgi:tRNA modification GTPase
MGIFKYFSEMMNFNPADTIVALATAPGSAAIALIRLSGKDSVMIADKFFYSKSLKKRSLLNSSGRTVHFGTIVSDGLIIDEVLVTVFRAPHSYTGQDSVEISCHGSRYIQQKLLQLFLNEGARMAEPGEYTMRAFLSGKLDLSQAEAVADLIAGNSPLSHKLAMQQMRGGFSDKIKVLRGELVNFASLVELELDFSEEDVEFAHRGELQKLIVRLRTVIDRLVESYEVGNVIKNGIPVAIVGRPNAGKSTLLNVLLEEDKAIVSDIPGTTRDSIEDEMVIEGVMFRFIDTAGLRTTTDVIEQIGVNRSYEMMKRSAIIIYLFDAHELSCGDLKNEISLLSQHIGSSQLLLVANKTDIENATDLREEFSEFSDIVFISAKEQTNIEGLKKKLVQMFERSTINFPETIVTNARHAGALKNASDALGKVSDGLSKDIPGDLLALDIRYALNELGVITGQVTSDDLLENIFSRFCIGK